jgi:hypothetical protein
MENLKQVCAVIDMQGYILHKNFYPREIAVSNEMSSIWLEVECPIKRSFLKNTKCEMGYRFQKEYIHGIPLDSIRGKLGLKVLKPENIGNVIRKIYNKVKTAEKDHLACKNQQVSEILAQYGIPHINLEYLTVEGERYPKLQDLDNTLAKGQVWFCPLHTCLNKDNVMRKNMRCSLRKSQLIWRWIQNKIFVNDLFETITVLNDKNLESYE